MSIPDNSGEGPQGNSGGGPQAPNRPTVFRPGVPLRSGALDDQLGFLADLTGDWKGTGFNVVALPDKHDNMKFRLMVNATLESFTFSPTGIIPNRGNLQDDIFIFGLQYLQKVDDAQLKTPLHLEPGLWLNVPATTAPAEPATVVRLATIPHGDALLAQGDAFEVQGGPAIGTADTTPFTLDSHGNRVNDPNKETYLKPYFNTTPPDGIPAAAILDPNIVLSAAIKGQNITKTTVLRVNATPVGGINGTPVTPQPENVGGIVNIPFVVTNANANSMSAIFWIETIETGDGKQWLQLQYTQTVILDFPVPGPDGNMLDIKWPHVSVATLVKSR